MTTFSFGHSVHAAFVRDTGTV